MVAPQSSTPPLTSKIQYFLFLRIIIQLFVQFFAIFLGIFMNQGPGDYAILKPFGGLLKQQTIHSSSIMMA